MVGSTILHDQCGSDTEAYELLRLGVKGAGFFHRMDGTDPRLGLFRRIDKKHFQGIPDQWSLVGHFLCLGHFLLSAQKNTFPKYQFSLMKFVLLGIAMLAMATAMAQSKTPLLPFQGTWEGTVNGHRYVEQWTCANGLCDGSAISYRGDTISMTETTRIMAFAGQWIYLVWTRNGPAVAFTRTFADDHTWTFENTDHDFPQRINYTASGDALDAYIAGPGEDGEMRFDFRLKRVE